MCALGLYVYVCVRVSVSRVCIRSGLGAIERRLCTLLQMDTFWRLYYHTQCAFFFTFAYASSQQGKIESSTIRESKDSYEKWVQLAREVLAARRGGDRRGAMPRYVAIIIIIILLLLLFRLVVIIIFSMC